MNSLAGRLFWGAVLLVVAPIAGSDVNVLLTSFSVLSWILVGVLLVSFVVFRGTAAARTAHSEHHWSMR